MSVVTDGASTGQQLEPRRLRLRPVVPPDYDFLYACAVDPAVIQRWRFRGHTPSPDEFVARLWEDVLAQFVMVDRRSDERVGLVTLYGPNHRHQYAYLAVLASPAYLATGVAFEGAAALLSYGFRTWPLRKVYAETLEFNYASFARGNDRYFEVEGRLRDHEWHDGDFHDLLLLAITRDRWAEAASLLQPLLSAEPVR